MEWTKQGSDWHVFGDRLKIEKVDAKRWVIHLDGEKIAHRNTLRDAKARGEQLLAGTERKVVILDESDNPNWSTGVTRAAARLERQRAQWADTPFIDARGRQVWRRKARGEAKDDAKLDREFARKVAVHARQRAVVKRAFDPAALKRAEKLYRLRNPRERIIGGRP